MPVYEWRNLDTGEIVEVSRSIADSSLPPTEDGNWERAYSLTIGQVKGAGNSKSHSVSTREKS